MVHIHWFDPYVFSDSVVRTYFKLSSTLLELWVLRLLGVSVVWTCHNVRAHDVPYPRVEYVLKRLLVERNLCERVFVHCESAKDDLIETYDLAEEVRREMTVVPHGHYLDDYENTVDSTAAREELGIDTDGTVFLFFGMIRPYKNVPRLIESFRSVADVDSRLVIAGKPTSERLARQVRAAAGEDDRIRMELSFIPSDRVQFYLNAADVVVLPLKDVSMSGSSMLAMSFGKALVVPNIGCVAEIVGDGGAIVYDADKPDGLAGALKTSERRDLVEMGETNYRLAEQSGWDITAQRTIDVYRDVSGEIPDRRQAHEVVP
jgi:glycosyltransferase involved in cell wall biosynthesis